MENEPMNNEKDSDGRKDQSADPRRPTIEEIRYWQSRPPWERFDAIAKLAAAEYLRKYPDTPPESGWKNAEVRILPFPEGLDEDK